jgi:hypothetical protein
MKRQPHLLLWRLFLGLIFSLSPSAWAADLPDGYAVHDKTESPDGRYGIEVPTADLEDSGSGDNVTYLAVLKTHQALGKILCDTYFEGENHFSLDTYWSPDSTWCVVLYDGRYGYSSIAILLPKRSGLTEINIGKHIDAALKSAAGDDGHGDAYFRFAAGRKLLVRATSFTGSPKKNDADTRYALFEGTFDLNSGKWTRSDARRLSLPGPKDDGYEVYSPVLLAFSAAYSTYTSDDYTGQGVDALDETMNDVYISVRAVLPAERFEKVKKDQIAWLKQRDGASSDAEKCKLMEARIKVLQDLLW